MGQINLQATIGGLAAQASVTAEAIFGALDPTTGVLLVDMSKTIKPGARETRLTDCAVLTNNASCDDYDSLFTEEDIRDAIGDYYSFAGRGLLRLDASVARFDPASKIEPDGLDDRGRKYRIATDMSNGQLAVIALCWFAVRQSGFSRQLESFDDYMDLAITSVMPGSGMKREVAGYTMGGQLAIGADGWPV